MYFYTFRTKSTVRTIRTVRIVVEHSSDVDGGICELI